MKKFIVKSSSLSGGLVVPGSKSHTIRALVAGLLADGTSHLISPLESSDTRSCFSMVGAFGGTVSEQNGQWVVTGVGGKPKVPDNIIDTGNSGTTLYIGLALSALADGATVFTGDAQIRRRPVQGVLDALVPLGADAFSTRANGCPPAVVKGPMRGGRTSVQAVTSQYLTALLMAAPCADGDTEIEVPLLNEAPYIDMTLEWLTYCGIKYEHDNYKTFFIRGNQRYKNFSRVIPADFSSASFFIVAAAVTKSSLVISGLDLDDTQGDKEILNIVRSMGAAVSVEPDGVYIVGNDLSGGEFDLNAMPDALPILAVCACAARGETRLVNVAQARVKETDRIAVMQQELSKMGADITERDDGLVIRPSKLHGAHVSGHSDHRVVMALTVAGLIAEGETVIDTADAVAVTFPEFFNLMKKIGADIRGED